MAEHKPVSDKALMSKLRQAAPPKVLKDATIVIDRNRIAAIGPRADITVPKGARVVEVAGKYIMPGIIDVHAHGPAGSQGIIPEQNWAFFASLAYGVTTEHDPSNDTEEIFSASEMQKAGMSQDFSWAVSARQYFQLYQRVMSQLTPR